MENGPRRCSALLHLFPLCSVHGSLADVSSEQYGHRGHLCKTGFATRAKTAGTGRSRRRSRARRHLRAAVPCSCSHRPQQPLLKPNRQQDRQHLVLLCRGSHPLGLCLQQALGFPCITYQKPCHRGINLMSFWDHCSHPWMNSFDTEFLQCKSHIYQDI